MPVSEDPDEVEAVVLDTEGHKQRLVNCDSRIETVFSQHAVRPLPSLSFFFSLFLRLSMDATSDLRLK